MGSRRFGTAGIRGVTNLEITPELALRLARAAARVLRRRGAASDSVSVGHDTRWGAELLGRAASAGFAAEGFHVPFLGCVPTGVFSLNVARTRQAGGLYVTGSHMPPDRIGLLLVEHDGAMAPFSFTDEVEAGLDAGSAPGVPPDRLGRLEESFHPYELYVSEIMQRLDARLCRRRKFRVLVDPANGAASYVAKEFFEWLGCAVELIHFDPNPVPDRPSEPRASTVGAAVRAVREGGHDLGVCFDVDADRSLFIDASGAPASEDAVGALFADHELKPGDLCVVPVNSSGLIERVCAARGARLEYCRIGQPHVVEALKTRGAVFSYEESGKYWFGRVYPWADGLYSAGRLLELMARTERPFAELAAAHPRYHQEKRNVEADPARHAGVLERVSARLRTELADGLERDVSLDGLKRVYRDGAWLLFRPSGTEPLIRVYSDAPDGARARELAEAGERLLRDCLA
jgi:phosphomannomutase/phosphoglucomutase